MITVPNEVTIADAASGVIAPQPGNYMFVFQEIEHPDGGPGRRLGFTNVQARPRGYAELADAKLHQKLTIPLEMINGTILDTDIDGIDRSAYVNITATLESQFTSLAIGLVRGGWLPSALAATRANAAILIDRNLVTEIVSRFDSGQLVGRDQDFLDLFHDAPVRINPMLFALEGNGRSAPDPALAKAQLEEVITKLSSALPAATLMVGPYSLVGLLGLLNETEVGMAQRQTFLLEVAPTLVPPVARRDMDARFDQILAAAARHQVPYFSLVVLAALSCVVTPNGSTPAKRLIKPKAMYSDADAYNALCDLRSLDILILLMAYFPTEATQLCTADKNLALFWCGLEVDDMVREEDGVSYSISPHTALLPDAYAQRWLAAIHDHENGSV